MKPYTQELLTKNDIANVSAGYQLICGHPLTILQHHTSNAFACHFYMF